MPVKTESRIRVTVMLGNSLTDRDTLAALELLGPDPAAEVLGLFIEDSELLSLADIPVVREYCRLTQAGRRLQADELERQFRSQARRAERALAEMVNPRGCPWSFRALRGDPVDLLRQTLAGVDLMLLGATAGLPPVTVRRPAAAKRPVMAVFNRPEPATRALRVALRMAESSGAGLVVALAADSPQELDTLREQARGIVGERPVDYLEISSHSIAGTLEGLRRHPAGQLVLGMPAEPLDDHTIALLRGRSNCTVILVK
jgi:hypothetical protein